MTLEADAARYYSALSDVYNKSAGYTNPEAEELRIPIKERFWEYFRGRHVLEIACGTGYWTEAIAETANTVLATDINPSLIATARKRCAHLDNVCFRVADAYQLDDIGREFDAAFAHWWWSHMPKKRIHGFLDTLHSRLKPGSLVLFRDHLPSHRYTEKRHPFEGDNIEERMVPDGSVIGVVKNYPSEEEVLSYLADTADDMQYIRYPDEGSWDVVYRTR